MPSPAPRIAFPLVLAVLALGCGKQDTDTRQLAAYDALDDCFALDSEADCTAADGCQWFAIGAPCVEGMPCPGGVCQTVEPCRDHADRASCEADADNGCAWASVELACPAGVDCDDIGYCYQPGGDDDCVCACPAYCPAGADCPPCDCDCDGGGGAGGGTCTCSCPACAPGEPCPPCACDCEPDGGCTGGGSGGGGSTCTCSCEACPVGADCPPCACDCDIPTNTCACPDCAPGQPCPPCTCDGGPAPSGGGSDGSVPPTDPDPCTAYNDEGTCTADPTCVWFGIGAPCAVATCDAADKPGENGNAPCIEGASCCPDGTWQCNAGDGSAACSGHEADCPGGVCQSAPTDPCVCACPDCAPGQECPPCTCDCDAGSCNLPEPAPPTPAPEPTDPA